MLLVRELRDYEEAERNWTQTSSNETQKAFGKGGAGGWRVGWGGVSGGEAGGKLLQNGNFF